MNSRMNLTGWIRILALPLLVALGLVVTSFQFSKPSAAAVTRFVGPTSSQPLALTADDAFMVVANPDNNSVTFFDLRNDRNRRVAEVPANRTQRSRILA